ncbi:DUF6168 family protein [Arenibacter lacus]|uniref:DUF6168 family protein n=1 Tax=Arenibacter lacus TaxID=2608629 RepID=UPI00123DDF52|nr:DUF6168 family protein [Arenibacter lacus]
MFKKNLLHRFYFTLFLSYLLVFGLHLLILYALGLPLTDHKILLAYGVNIIMAVAIFSILYIFREPFKDQLGFLYLAGSMLKFVVFFIVFYPAYKLDGEMETIEFSAFFVPYVVGLIVETLYTAKILNSINNS